MPPAKRWFQFFASAGLLLFGGIWFTQKGPPSDAQFIASLSPELKEVYMKERRYREVMSEIMAQKMEDTQDKPAWLQGFGEMRKLDREVAEEARRAVECEDLQQALLDEKQNTARLQGIENKRT